MDADRLPVYLRDPFRVRRFRRLYWMGLRREGRRFSPDDLDGRDNLPFRRAGALGEIFNISERMARLANQDKKSGNIEHKHFYDICEYFNAGDVLVLNDTRVLPARIFGNRPKKEEKIEVLLLSKQSDDIWECLVRPGKKMKIGTIIEFSNILKGEVLDITESGERIIKFTYDGIFENILDEVGIIPLPPYIHEKLEDKERYQTIYSKYKGSVAAPTAGLHFTEELLKKIREKGVKTVYLTLHVGLGTFRPVKEDNIEDHIMHTEIYNVPEETIDVIKKAKKSGNRIFAVGTTSVRTLESLSHSDTGFKAGYGDTNIFIYPGFEFKIVDVLITNFHLPKSTLLMLVSAFSDREKVLIAYEEAKKNDYRFFSFGDAMLLI